MLNKFIEKEEEKKYLYLQTKYSKKKPLKMDYQCIVVYTIVRISPFYPYTTEWPAAGSSSKPEGCLNWIKSQIKRSARSFALFFFYFFYFSVSYIIDLDMIWV